jgi:DNA-binding MarR family transcriptional regulator
MKPEESVDFQIQMAWQSIRKLYNEVAAGYGFSWAAGKVLLAIDPEEGTPSTALGPKMGIESTSLSRLLNKMEAHAYIKRSSDPEDGRRVLVHLTEKGRVHREKAKLAVIKLNERLASLLGAEAFHDCVASLAHIDRSIQSGEVNADELRQ